MSDAAAPEERSSAAPFWLWPNLFGLDAVAVAIAWQHFFASALRIKIPTAEYAVLGLVVWVIYSADRVVDAIRLKSPESAAHRHRFYRQRLPFMVVLTAVGALAAAFFVLTQLPYPAVTAGAVLSLLVLLYFFHRIWVPGAALLSVIPKEVFSGFVFALGATLLGFVWSSEIPRGLWSKEVLCFGALCATNCLAISVWERGSDADNDPNAIAQLWPGSVNVFPRFALVLALAALAFAAWHRDKVGFPLLLASATGVVLIALLAHSADKFRPAQLRVLADVAVLLPALAFLPMTPWASIR